jgi:hypothetical protein
VPERNGVPLAAAAAERSAAIAAAVARADRADRTDRVDDQAATLRRLFARPQVRVLPVLLPELHCALHASWIAKLAQDFARQGERTLVIDAARAQVAATLGLRARFDLAHALRGECAFDAVLLDAGPNLLIAPAARALAQHDPADGLQALLVPLAAALAARGGCDLVLLLLTPALAAHRPRGDLLVPLGTDAAQMTRTLRDLDGLASAGEPLAPREGVGATPVFRLLFLGMDAGPAATLAQRLSMRLRPLRRTPAVRFAGAAQVARDLGPLVRASSGWSLVTMELMQ